MINLPYIFVLLSLLIVRSGSLIHANFFGEGRNTYSRMSSSSSGARVTFPLPVASSDSTESDLLTNEKALSDVTVLQESVSVHLQLNKKSVDQDTDTEPPSAAEEEVESEEVEDLITITSTSDRATALWF